MVSGRVVMVCVCLLHATSLPPSLPPSFHPNQPEPTLRALSLPHQSHKRLLLHLLHATRQRWVGDVALAEACCVALRHRSLARPSSSAQQRAMHVACPSRMLAQLTPTLQYAHAHSSNSWQKKQQQQRRRNEPTSSFLLLSQASNPGVLPPPPSRPAPPALAPPPPPPTPALVPPSLSHRRQHRSERCYSSRSPSRSSTG